MNMPRASGAAAQLQISLHLTSVTVMLPQAMLDSYGIMAARFVRAN